MGAALAISSLLVLCPNDEHGHHLLEEDEAVQDFTLRFMDSVVKGLRAGTLPHPPAFRVPNREFIGGMI